MRKPTFFAAAGCAAMTLLGGCALTEEMGSASESGGAVDARVAELEEANRVARLELAEEQERNTAQTFLMTQEIARLRGQISALRAQCGEACEE